MFKYWIVLFALCFSCYGKFQESNYDDYNLPSYEEWYDEYNYAEASDVNSLEAFAQADIKEDSIKSDDADIKKEENNEKPMIEIPANIQKYDVDYQIEDNRSEVKDDEANQNVVEGKENADDIKEISIEVNDEKKEEAAKDFDAFQQLLGDDNKISDDIVKEILSVDDKSKMDLNDLLPKDKQNIEDLFAPLPLPPLDDNKKEEIVNHGKDETNNFNDLTENKPPNVDIKSEMKDINEEPKNILDGTDNQFKNKTDNGNNKLSENNVDKNLNKEKETVDAAQSEEDTVDMVYKDLNEDLDKLLQTWNKLTADEDDHLKSAEDNPDDALGFDTIAQYEDKFGKPFGEDRILSQRQEDDDYEAIADENLSDLFEDEDKYEDTVLDEVVVNSKDHVMKDKKSFPIQYIGDALDADDKDKNIGKHDATESRPGFDSVKDHEVINDSSTENLLKNTTGSKLDHANQDDEVVEKNDNKLNLKKMVDEPNKEQQKLKKNVEDLTDAELDQLTKQFVMLHQDEMNFNSENFDRDVAPIHITLTTEPVNVTSPNYPSAYPTSATVDWILEGHGMGIEVNVTDLAINSAMGHYLLLKPGGIDESSDKGIVFAYRIDEMRKYRFRNVNKMFVRFEPKGGMSFLRGFHMSVKMIEPPVTLDEEVEPEPEPVVPAPLHTMTLLLGGINVSEFENIRDDFRSLLADMATMYINANNIDPGNNSTNFTTQITRTYICNLNWPGFESCVEVEFAVPLVYDDDRESRLNEEDLAFMWNAYVDQDPFASRLRRLSISEYSAPNDGSILAMWLLVATGALISTSMLAFVLWRFSCFENYTMMQAYSDTDSLHNEKRNVDMYPTPHQTLPPLFTESEYRWYDSNYEDTSRDMGGFTNRTYVKDEPSDESDVEVVVAGDRNYSLNDHSVV